MYISTLIKFTFLFFSVKMENPNNPWHIQSLYDLLFFVCPSCTYKNNSKQEFVEHASSEHPESINQLQNINDGSTSDVNFSWNSEIDVKDEFNNTSTTIFQNYIKIKDEYNNEVKIEPENFENEENYDNIHDEGTTGWAKH